MAHLPLLPVLLPAATAVALLALGDARLRASRALALASTALGLLLALVLLRQADGGALLVYRLGDWPAPFGIALVADRLSALMVLLTSAVALPVLLYAVTAASGDAPAWDARGRHFHALFQFQLMGLNGAFVTGDLFNLFVFFEVLLIASYVLMLHGLGRERLRAGLHYVVLNLAASALFLLGLALVYAAAGTLNLADLALRAPQVAGVDAPLLQAGALLLLVVFAFKAALVPLSLWLPATYSAAGAPVAALFALMTKVGVYAIWRVHGVAFGAGAEGADGANALAQPLLLPLALLTCLLGVAGAMAARTLARLVAWLNVASVGTLLVGLGLYGAAGWSAALFYLPGSTLVVALMFLLAEVVGRRRGEAGDRLEPAPAVRQPALLGGLFVLGAVSIAGLPPLPGFMGKVLMLQAAAGHPAAAAVWGVLLLMGLGALLALARAGSVLFWKARQPASPAMPPAPAAQPSSGLAAVLLLAAAGVGLSVAAAPVQRYTRAAAEQLTDVAAYARAVLPEVGGAQPRSTRPYSGRLEGAQP